MSPWVSAVSDQRLQHGDQSAVGRAQAADLLGVPVDAPVVDIQRAFRSAVKHAHPDGGAADGEAFGELHTAREVLLAGRSTSAASATQDDGGGDGHPTDEEPVKHETEAAAPPQPAVETAASGTEPEPPGQVASPTGDAPAGGDRSSLFGRGVLLMAAGLGLMIGLLIAAAVVAGNETQSVRIAPASEAPDECIVVSAGTIESASCDVPGALSIASQSATSAACAAGSTSVVPG